MPVYEAQTQPPVRFRDLAEDQDIRVLGPERSARLPFHCQLPLAAAAGVPEPRPSADPDDLQPLVPLERGFDVAGLAQPLVVAFQIGDQHREMRAGRRRHVAALHQPRDPAGARQQQR
jgi:hypothetical protein